jgi:hypothetical protein
MIKGLLKELYPSEPILHRPDPATATGEDIAAALHALTNWNWHTGYTYGHIVIDDYNMGDGSIFFCLTTSHYWDSKRDTWSSHAERGVFRRECLEQGITDSFYRGVNVGKLEFWEQAQLTDILEVDAEVCRFLRWLLRTSEEARDQAWHILDGREWA